MKIRSITPATPVARDAVRCVFVIEQEAPDEAAAFLILPSVSAYASFSLETRSSAAAGRIVVEHAPGAGLDAGVQFGLTRATRCEYRGRVREVCVVFNPCAVHEFFDEDELTAGHPVLAEFGARLLAAADDASLVDELEARLAERRRNGRPEILRAFIAALDENDPESPPPVSDIALRLGVTRQTLNARCRRYLGLTASEFRKIHRFRRFVDARLAAGDDARLTDLAYEFGFFDQSHLNKDFRSLTLLRPGEFFERVDFSPTSQVVVVWQ